MRRIKNKYHLVLLILSPLIIVLCLMFGFSVSTYIKTKPLIPINPKNSFRIKEVNSKTKYNIQDSQKTLDNINGFVTPTIVPTIIVNTTNIGKITETDFASKIILNDPAKTLTALKDYVTVRGVIVTDITNITFNSGVFKVYYHLNSSQVKPILSVTQTIGGFAYASNRPTFKVKTNINKILPSKIDGSNYGDYLEVIDRSSSLITEDLEFLGDDIDGSLIINGSYYNTSFHGEGASTTACSFSFKGFGITPPVKKTGPNIVLIASVASAGAVLLIFLIVAICLILKRRRINRNDRDISSIKIRKGEDREIEEIMKRASYNKSRIYRATPNSTPTRRTEIDPTKRLTSKYEAHEDVPEHPKTSKL